METTRAAFLTRGAKGGEPEQEQGPKRLPEMGRSLGRGLREFKHSVSDDKAEPERLELASDRTREHENAA